VEPAMACLRSRCATVSDSRALGSIGRHLAREGLQPSPLRKPGRGRHAVVCSCTCGAQLGTSPAASRWANHNISCGSRLVHVVPHALAADRFIDLDSPDEEPLDSLSSRARVWRVVITGGPCGGKSTSLAHLRSRMEALGFTVYTLPETATLMFNAGCTGEVLCDSPELWQTKLLELMLQMEDSLTTIAARQAVLRNRPSIVFCDRGALDAKAYCSSDEEWLRILERLGYAEGELRDNRYDAVIHMTTAADGAEEFYTTENNGARTETAEEARALDKRVLKGWLGHDHLHICTNKGVSFEAKVRQAAGHVARLVGAPPPGFATRKFLLEPGWSIPDDIPCSEVFESETIYLQPVDPIPGRPEAQDHIRKRTDKSGTSVYVHRKWESVRADSTSGAVRVEIAISKRQYNALKKAAANPKAEPLVKRLQSFQWQDTYYEINEVRGLQDVRGVSDQVTTLEVDVGDLKGNVKIPPFMSVVRDVTEDPEIHGYALARGLKDNCLAHACVDTDWQPLHEGPTSN